VINHILSDAMVVADLTGHNANVFYELAVRHAARKPYVQMIQKGETIPFDVAGMRTIEVDHTDLDSVASTKEELRKQMVSTAVPEARLERPISVAIDFDKLHRSEDPAKRQLADILSAITDLKTAVEQRMSIIEYLEANLFRSPRITTGHPTALDLSGLQEAVKEITTLVHDLRLKNTQLLTEKAELEKEKAELENRLKQT